jgi:hypothetical protein
MSRSFIAAGPPPFACPRFSPKASSAAERDLANLFREVAFDVDKFLAAIVGYGRLHVGP